MPLPNPGFNAVKQESGRIRRSIRRQVVNYIGTALGLVAGLAWNEAVKSLIEHLFPLSSNTLLAKFAYAALLTVIVVIITFYFLRAVASGSDRSG